MGHLIVLFDAECRLCNGTVGYLRAWDRRNTLVFEPIQGELAAAVLARHGLQAEALNGIWLVKECGGAGERVYGRSEAVLEILRGLGGWWRLAVVGYGLPRGWREWIYGVVAENRYRWFGRNGGCGVNFSSR